MGAQPLGDGIGFTVFFYRVLHTFGQDLTLKYRKTRVIQYSTLLFLEKKRGEGIKIKRNQIRIKVTVGVVAFSRVSEG